MAVACLKLNPLMTCSASNFMLTFLKSRTFPIEEEEEKKPTELNITAGEKKISPISQEDLSIFISKHIVMLVWNG